MSTAAKKKTTVIVPAGALRRAGFKPGQELEFKAAEGVITVVPKIRPTDDYPMERVLRIIKEARENPLSGREAATLDAELAAYGAKQAKKLGIKEADIPRIIHDSRARRRSSKSRSR